MLIHQELWDAISQWMDAQEDDMTEALRTLVRIPSISDKDSDVKPFGQACRDVMDETLRMGREKGLFAQNIDYHVGAARENSERCDIGLWGHLDVVPVGDGWQYPPFKGVIEQDHMIGRGSADNKAAIIASLYAITCLRAIGVERRYKAGVFFGCNEEVGMADIPYFLEREPAPALSLVVDSGFPVCYGEAGSINMRLTSDKPFSVDVLDFSVGKSTGSVPAVAHVTLRGCRELTEIENIIITHEDGNTIVTGIGIAGHPAFPRGTRNALGVLAAYLLDSGTLRPQDAARFDFLRRLGQEVRGSALEISKEYGLPAMLYCTPTVGGLEGGKFALIVNIRFPAGDPEVTDPTIMNVDMLMPSIQRVAKEQRMNVTILRSCEPSLFMPPEHPLVKTLVQVYHDTVRDWGSPFILNGGCYAHAIPNALGFGPGPMWNERITCLLSGHGGAHGPDECQSLKGMVKLAKVLAYTLVELEKHDLSAARRSDK